MATPKGFDPVKMTLPVNIPRNDSRPSTPSGNTFGYSAAYYNYNYYRPSLWKRFNNGVIDIGNWFADHAEGAIGICGIILALLLALIGIGSIVQEWIQDGFWAALITAVLIGIAAYIAWYIGAVIIVFAVNIVMYGLRFIFWNGWTLIVVLAIALGSICMSFVPSLLASHSDSAPPPTEIQMEVPATETYVCTARTSLRVRSQPNTNSTVVANLRNGEEVEVYEITNGFARLILNGRWVYVSAKYLRKKD